MSEFERVLRPGGSIVVTDIDAEHFYGNTSIPAGKKDIEIRSFKHSKTELVEIAKCHGLAPLTFCRFAAEEIADLVHEKLLRKFANAPKSMLFYLCVLQKVAK